MSRPRSAAPVLLVLLLAACGGTAVVESGAGGAGSTTHASSQTGTTGSGATSGSGTSSVAAGSTGSGATCEQLTTSYLEALAAAQACDACVDFDPCIGGPTFPDSCGCPVPMNGQASDLIEKVKGLNAEWTGAGCGPFECGQPCSVSPSAYCAPGGGTDCNGKCSY